jgi:hypothetical protein
MSLNQKSTMGEMDTSYILYQKNEDINEILRGEMSAVEAYRQVEKKVDDDPESYRLKQFRLDHENAIQYWKREAKEMGKIPEPSSSVWGLVVEAFVGASKLMGDDTALMALKRGEEHGLANYRAMLNSEMLTNRHKEEIRNTFIPRQRRHIESINALLKME